MEVILRSVKEPEHDSSVLFLYFMRILIWAIDVKLLCDISVLIVLKLRIFSDQLVLSICFFAKNKRISIQFIIRLRLY